MLSGVILAGGKGTRMGGLSKALLTVGGSALIERQLAVMERVCGDIVIAANDAGQLAALVGGRCPIVPDVYPECGPLAGMHAAFPRCAQDAIWVVGCDMPFLSGRAALDMLDVWRRERADAVVPADAESRLHPLHGIFARRTHASLAGFLRRQRLGVQQWLASLHTVVFDAASQAAAINQPPFWTNVNTPEEYEAACRLSDSVHKQAE